jgi:cytochrome c5
MTMRPARLDIPAAFGAAVAALGLAVAVATAAAQGAQGPRPLPPGDGRDVLATACGTCHTLNIVMAMREGPAGWRRHVTNMVMRGAQLDPHEVDTVVAYLAANFGPGVPLAASQGAGGSAAANAVAIALPPGAGKALVETRCTLCHDLERVAGVKRAKTQWPALVANMVGRGAPATPDEAQEIAAYLAANFGE